MHANGELQPAGPQRLDFPALQHDAGFEALLDEVIVPRPAVDGDASGCLVFFHHGTFYWHRAVVRAGGGGDNRRMEATSHA